MKFELSNYLIAEIRDGQSTYKKDKAIESMDYNDLLVVYRDDVYTYYYAVPKRKKNLVGTQLLEFFYSDNYDYTQEKLDNFMALYPEIFTNE